MIFPLSDDQIFTLEDFFQSDAVSEGCFDFIALHGFLTGLATGDESLVEENWLSFIFDGEPDYQDQEQQQEIEKLIHQQAKFIQRNLYLGEDFEIPCEIFASTFDETNDLTDWCFGFLEAIALNEELWFADKKRSETVAELILPMGILSEQFIEPELEHLYANQKERQQLADSIISNIQNLYLLFRE